MRCSIADRLRTGGIDCSLDQYEECPPEGWPLWMERQIRESQFVIVVCSEYFSKKLTGQVKPTEGLGVRWEGKLIYQHLYSEAANSKFIPVLLYNGSPEHIPIPLQSATYYRPQRGDDYERLYWRLRGAPLRGKPPLGEIKPLAPKPRKTNPGLFVSGFIDVPLWNAAEWEGVLYYCDPMRPPVLGLLFKHEKPALKIFDQWHERFGSDDSYEEMRITIVEGEIPGKDSGYTVCINANVEHILSRAEDLGLDIPNEHILVISRMHRMNPSPGFNNLAIFKHAVRRFGCYHLCPAAVGTKGVRLLTSGLLKKEINFRNVSEITESDIDSVVLGK